jgi:transcriptional regulator with XRE-family HTH domain
VNVEAQNQSAVDPCRIGRQLRFVRRAAGLRQTDVALRAGLQRENVSRAEAGRGAQTLDLLCRIATACGVPVASILEVQS